MNSVPMEIDNPTLELVKPLIMKLQNEFRNMSFFEPNEHLSFWYCLKTDKLIEKMKKQKYEKINAEKEISKIVGLSTANEEIKYSIKTVPPPARKTGEQFDELSEQLKKKRKMQ